MFRVRLKALYRSRVMPIWFQLIHLVQRYRFKRPFYFPQPVILVAILATVPALDLRQVLQQRVRLLLVLLLQVHQPQDLKQRFLQLQSFFICIKSIYNYI